MTQVHDQRGGCSTVVARIFVWREQRMLKACLGSLLRVSFGLRPVGPEFPRLKHYMRELTR